MARVEGYRVAADVAAVERERARLDSLCNWRDPHTIAALVDTGIGPGWHCLEAGAGSGTVARWMTVQVAPGGAVVAGDVDLRFLTAEDGNDPPGMEIVRLDVRDDPLPEASYDLIHARALSSTYPSTSRCSTSSSPHPGPAGGL